MPAPKDVFVLCEDDYNRIEGMLMAFGRALDTIFERRKIEPQSSPEDSEDFDPVAEKAIRDYF